MNFKINNKNILKFVMPCIMTMIFTSIFVMSDGIVASNFINETALAAINLVLPVTSLFLAIGLMFGSGISAICSKLLGEGKIRKAKESMSSILVVSFILGLIFTILIQFNIDNMLDFLGASEATYEYAYSYLSVISCFSAVLMMQTIFQSLMIVSGKAFTYFKTMIGTGITKILLSCLLVGVFNLGTVGLAIAGAVGYLIPVIVSFAILIKKNEDGLSLVKPVFDRKVILDTCANGSSEMVTNLAMAVTTFLFNSAMLKLIGDDGVSAVTIILYIQFLLSAVFLGYSIGISPVIGFNYGQKNSENLKKIFTCSLRIIIIISIASCVVGVFGSNILAGFFAEKGTEIFDLASSGLRLFSIGFLFMGINIYASGMFTAYSNGKISAFISAIRTIVLISSSLLILPNKIGVTGVWIAVPIAEFLTIFISLFLFKKYKVVYMYGQTSEVKQIRPDHDNLIITVNRTFGSGGKEIAKRIADELDIAFYDEDIINDVINEDGITDGYLEKYSDSNFNKNYDFKFATSFTNYNESLTSDVFEKHSKVIAELGKLNDCIFVGNCSDYILKDKNTFNICIYASNEEYILDRLYEKNEMDKSKSKEELLEIVRKINSSREKYYEYYTGGKVDDINNYDLVIDVSKLGIKENVKIIVDIIKKLR